MRIEIDEQSTYERKCDIQREWVEHNDDDTGKWTFTYDDNTYTFWQAHAIIGLAGDVGALDDEASSADEHVISVEECDAWLRDAYGNEQIDAWLAQDMRS